MDYWTITHMFLGGFRDLLTFHTLLLIKGVIGGILLYWVISKA